MVRYRRNFVAGGTYFFTVTLRDRDAALLVDHVDLLRDAFAHARRKLGFAIDAIVILPEHLHSILTMGVGDHDYPGLWKQVKSRFTRGIVAAGARASRDARGEFDVWQRRYWEHTIRDEDDFARHVDYIHFNPVRHGHVGAVRDWPYSSFHRYVRQGALSESWGGDVDLAEAGERLPLHRP